MSIQDVKWPCAKPLIGKKPAHRTKSCKVLVKDGEVLATPIIEKIRKRKMLECDSCGGLPCDEGGIFCSECGREFSLQVYEGIWQYVLDTSLCDSQPRGAIATGRVGVG